jgi:hypothetical protein
MKELAAEKIPCGEELASVIDDNVMDLKEWGELMNVTPSINLEKEN